MTLKSRYFLIYCLILMTLSQLSFAKIQKRSVFVATQADVELIETPGVEFVSKENGIQLYFKKNIIFPLKLNFTDSFGARVEVLLQDPSDIDSHILNPKIIKRKSANGIVYSPPKYCSRLRYDNQNWHYETHLDSLNHKPRIQFSDADFLKIKFQKKIFKKFDKKNVLAVQKIKVSYDYEDTSILDYKGKHPISKTKGHLVYEGEGGFYANFHYAVIPYDKRVLNLSRQTLLKLV